jgi:AcrR family transcriptional regulator
VTPGRGSLGPAASATQPTRRAVKRERQRAVVERTALDLFRKHGFDDVTVERIAAEAGVGPTTFYRYFGTKHGVLFGYEDRWLQALRDMVDGLDTERPRAQQLRDLVVVVVRFFDAELDTMQLRDEILATTPTLLPRALAVQRRWEVELAQSLVRRRGVRDGDLDVQVDAAIVQVVLRAGFRSWRAGAAPSLAAAVSAAWSAAEGAVTLV